MRRIALASVAAILVGGTCLGDIQSAALKPPIPPPTYFGEPPDARYDSLTDMIFTAGGLGAYPLPDGTIVVLLTTTRAGAFPIADAESLGLSIRTETSPLDQGRVEFIKRSVTEFAAANPVTTNEFGVSFEPVLGQVVVEGDAPSEAFEALLKDFPGELTHRQVEGGRASRSADYPAFWGGAEVGTLTAPGDCSTGFTVRSAGSNYRYMTTAGHCFQINDDVYSPGSGLRIGRVTKRPAWPNRDMAGIGGELYAPAIYRGPESPQTVGTVIGAGNFALGFGNYCRSGATTFEQCAFHVVDLSAAMCWGGFCTDGVAKLTGGVCSADGDSGGPWFAPVIGSSDVFIRGIHIGQFCANVYAEKWPKIRDTLGVEIVTG